MLNGSLKTFTDPNHQIIKLEFSAEIRIDNLALSTISKEGVASLLAHELLHGYLSYRNIDYKKQTAQHSYIAANYLSALSSFLQNKFGIPANDAMTMTKININNPNQDLLILDNILQERIFNIQGVQVMIDRNFAELYEVEIKAINQAVKRNIDWFPQNFRFQLTAEEKNELVTICDRFGNKQLKNH